MTHSKPSRLTGLRILFVDDEPPILRVLQRALSSIDCTILLAGSGQEALSVMAVSPADVVVSDMRMPGMSGEELLSIVAERYPDSIRLVLTGHADIASVLRAINQGRIWGYLQKPWDNEQLILALEQAVFAQDVLSERTLLRDSLHHYQSRQRTSFEGFVGASVPMQAVYRAIEYCAPSNASVFITGASGTGKEVAAAAIHNLSGRKQRPFVAINCAAIPGELMESEIFGHVKGAFSSAFSNREGAATMADGGTLFFDEIGEMDIGLQAKLLRFIQTGCFQRVGSGKVEKVDIRFISATNRDPLQAILDQRLREDIYYRLNVVSIHLPPLTDRNTDALLLANQFLTKFSAAENKIFIGIDSDGQKLIGNYAWPGNIRQLQNCMYSGVVMSAGPLLTAGAIAQALHLSGAAVNALLAQTSDVPVYAEPFAAPEKADILPLAQLERMTIERAIKSCAGNVVNAATALGVSPSTLYRKVQAWRSQC